MPEEIKLPIQNLKATAFTAERLAEIDPFSPEILADPFPYLEALRSQSPCIYNKTRDIWIVSRFSDIDSVFMHPELFSSAKGTGFIPVKRSIDGGVILACDRPFHQRIRRTVQPRFSMPSVESLEASLEAFVDGLLDKALEKKNVDLVEAIAEPVAAWILKEMMGIEASTHDLVSWSDAGFRLLGPPDTYDFKATLERFKKGLDFMGEKLDKGEYRENSVFSTVANAVKEGMLDHEEAVSLCMGIIVAGVDTSVASLSTAVGLLAADPEQYQLLRENPDLAANAFEETLRFDGPILYWFRHCNEDTVVAGTTIPKGARVMISLSSAGRDAERFEDSDRFDINHDAKGNLSFGRGEHLCLGAPVARLEGKVVLKKLAERVKTIEPTAPSERRKMVVIRAFEKVPVMLQPN